MSVPKYSSSSTTPQQISSSTNNIGMEQTYFSQMQEQLDKTNKPQTPAQIRATNEGIKVKWLVLLVGVISVLLIIVGCIVQLVDKTNGKDIWSIFAPIITSGLSGLLGYLAGDKQSGKGS